MHDFALCCPQVVSSVGTVHDQYDLLFYIKVMIKCWRIGTYEVILQHRFLDSQHTIMMVMLNDVPIRMSWHSVQVCAEKHRLH